MARVTTPLRKLGRSGIEVPALGVGTNQWGASGKGADVIAPVFTAALDAGVGLIDTAEIYQSGRSERVLGECMRRDSRPAIVVGKFAPLPFRLSLEAIGRALDASLDRLGMKAFDLYLVHWPFTFLGIARMMDALADAVRAGKVRAVGVSNFSAKQMHLAADALARHGLPLAANEVWYSVTRRFPERNGVLEACRTLDVALIAYRPIAGGGLATRSDALGAALRRVAEARQKTLTQVALNWLLRRDGHVIPIPGATSVAHLRENADVLEWSLTEEEFAVLERAYGK
jgi:aryl-alcohol dehydrogenase-like predicted oxidoreductase